MKLSWKSVGAFVNPVALAGTAASIGGDLYAADQQRKASERANEANVNLTREQIAHQEQFAKMGVRWRVADAVAAGLHPLAALGVQPAQFSPVSSHFEPDYSKAEFGAKMGQNISRAVQSVMTPYERAEADLRLEHMKLENDLLKSQISSINQPQRNSGMPVPGAESIGSIGGQGDSMILDKPLERVAPDREKNWQETGWYPSVSYMRSPTGLVPIMPPNLAEALESDQTNQAQWALRYKGGPNVSPMERPSRRKLPPGAADWIWNFKMQEWQPISRRELERRGRQKAEDRYRSFYRSRDKQYERFLP